MVEISIDLKDIGTGTSADTRGGGGISLGGAKGISTSFKAALKSLGLISLLGSIVAIVMSWRPLMSIVGGLVKLVSQFLVPISMVLTTLLFPILLLLKPIVRSIRQIMLPFFKQAMQFMKEGFLEKSSKKIGLGATTVLAGIMAVISLLSGEVLKTIASVLISVLAPIVGIFSGSAEQYLTEELLPNIGAIVDVATASSIASMAAIITNLGTSAGSDMDTFIGDVVTSLDRVFPALSNSFLKETKKALETAKTDLAKSSLLLQKNLFLEWSNLGVIGAGAIASAFDAMIAALPNQEKGEARPAEFRVRSGFERIFDKFTGRSALEAVGESVTAPISSPDLARSSIGVG